ncbi:VOC family protein [Actinocorallia lasiicapitis]
MREMPDYQSGTPCWAELDTPDLEVAKRFYGGLFGWTSRTSTDPADGGLTVFTLGAAGAVASAKPLFTEGARPGWTVRVAVADADAVCAIVLKEGGHVHEDPAPVRGRGTAAACADPTGAVFGLWQPDGLPGAAVTGVPGSFGWTELACRDIDAAKEFYGAVLEWTAETTPFAGSTYTVFSLDGRPVAGMVQMNEAWPAELPPHWMTYFTVADTDRACAELVRHGGTVSVPPSDTPRGRLAVVADPHGACFSFLQRAQG